MKLLKHPLFLIFLGMGLVFALAWVAAPILGMDDDDGTRRPMIFAGVVTAILGTVAIALWVWSRWGAWSLTRGLLANRDRTDGIPPELVASFETALGDLEARLPRAGLLEPGGIDKLPWVIVIGPPGTGKTTTLDRSGLRFTQLGRRVTGVGGTRNCVWWLSEDAVILDTAGRYADETASRDEWLAVLKLLRRYRKRRPIDAVVLEVSLGDVTDRGPEGVEDLAVTLRDRLDELQSQLGTRFPVYLTLTHLDRVDGFTAFCSTLPASERQTAWGFSLDVDLLGTERLSDVFKRSYDRLVDALHARTTSAVVAVADPAQRDAALCLPAELGRHRDALADLTDILFEGRRGGIERPWLTAVCFISPTQDGEVAPGVRARASADVGCHQLPRSAQAPAGQSLFVRGVFERVLEEAQSAARPTRQALRRQRILQVATAALLFPVVVLGSYAVAGTYSDEARWVEQTREATEALAQAPRLPPLPQDVDRAELQAELERQAALIRLLDEPPATAFTRRVQDASQAILLDRVDATLLAPLQRAWEDRLEQGRAWNPDLDDPRENDRFTDGWLALKADHVLGRRACEGASASDRRQFLDDYLAGLWRAEIEREGDPGILARGDLEEMLRRSIDAWVRAFLQDEAVRSRLTAPRGAPERARANLVARAPGDEIVFHLILAGAGLAGVRRQLSGEVLGDQGIELGFTHAGARVFFDRSDEGAEWWRCILDVQQPQSVDKEEAFLVRGGARWQRWIEGVQITGDVGSIDGLARTLSALARDQASELDEMLGLIGGNRPAQDEDPSLLAGITQERMVPQRVALLAGCAERVEKAASRIEDRSCPPCEELKRAFQPYADAVAGPEKGKERAAAYLAYKAALAGLQAALSDIATSSNYTEKALAFVLGAMRDAQSPLRQVAARRMTLVDALGQGRDQVDTTALDALLLQLETHARLVVQEAAEDRLIELWKSQVVNNPARPHRSRVGDDAELCAATVDFVKGTVAPFVDANVEPLLEQEDLKLCQPAEYPRRSGATIPISPGWCRETWNNLSIAASTRCPGAPPPPPPDPEPRQFNPEPTRIARMRTAAVSPSCPWSIQSYELRSPAGSWSCEVSTGRCNETDKANATSLRVKTDRPQDRYMLFPGEYRGFQDLVEEGTLKQREHVVDLTVRKDVCEGGFVLPLPFTGGDMPEASPPPATRASDAWRGIEIVKPIIYHGGR